MGEYDLPATIDKVLSVSGQSSLVYIGYSQGSQIALAEYSVNKTVASKVKLFVSFAPATYMGHVKSPIRLLAPYVKDIGVGRWGFIFTLSVCLYVRLFVCLFVFLVCSSSHP